MTRTAVVAGMGVVTPCGTDTTALWSSLLAARSPARLLAGPAGEPLGLACTVPDDGWDKGFRGSEQRRMDRMALLAVAAAEQAAGDAAIEDLGVPPERRGLVTGAGFSGVATITAQHDVLAERGARRLSPFGVAASMPSSAAAYAALRLDVRGPVTTVSTACASGTQAVIDAARLIEDDRADLVLAGGVEAAVHPLSLASFGRMEATSRRFDDPAAASRPFDADRDGLVIGEGAAFIVLVDALVAERAGRRARARVAGGATTTDAFHIVAPDPTGDGARRCLTAALEGAGVAPGDIAHVNAHGTATPLNDRTEGLALGAVFGRGTVPVTSVKGATGHLMGGAGAVEAVVALLSMGACLVPPTANCERLDPDIPLDVVRGQPRAIGAGPALSCSFGFGGFNAAVVFAPA